MNLALSGARSIQGTVMRGGTTRGLLFRSENLPVEQDHIDRIMMAAIGAPDPRQVDGLGGADLLLSKVAIVWPSNRPDTDIECRFGSIPPGSHAVKYGANCGNLSAAVALYAWQEGFAENQKPLRLFNPDSSTAMEARLLPEDSTYTTISGMPASGALLDLSFLHPSGTATNRLLPTGNAIDLLQRPDGRAIPASIVDSGALYVFVRAEDVGLPVAANSTDLQKSRQTMSSLEYLRGQAAVRVGLVETPEDAMRLSPAIPKLAFVSSPSDYFTEGSHVPVRSTDIHLVSRIISNQSFHKAYAVTGAIATASAAVVPGTVIYSLVGGECNPIKIGHPTGVLACTVRWSFDGNDVVIHSAGVVRTARRIADTKCYLPHGIL